MEVDLMAFAKRYNMMESIFIFLKKIVPRLSCYMVIWLTFRNG